MYVFASSIRPARQGLNNLHLQVFRKYFKFELRNVQVQVRSVYFFSILTRHFFSGRLCPIRPCRVKAGFASILLDLVISVFSYKIKLKTKLSKTNFTPLDSNLVNRKH